MRMWRTLGTAVAVLVIGVLGCLPFTSAEEGKSIPQMIIEAKTPADHQAIVARYREESAKFQKEAAQHAELAKWWASLAGGQSPGNYRYNQAEHCRKFTNLLEDAALEAQALAKMHENIAQSLAEDKQ